MQIQMDDGDSTFDCCTCTQQDSGHNSVCAAFRVLKLCFIWLHCDASFCVSATQDWHGGANMHAMRNFPLLLHSGKFSLESGNIFAEVIFLAFYQYTPPLTATAAGPLSSLYCLNSYPSQIAQPARGGRAHKCSSPPAQPHTCSHTHARARARAHTHTLAHTHTNTYTHTHNQHTITNTNAHSQSCTLSLLLSLSHPYSLGCTPCRYL